MKANVFSQISNRNAVKPRDKQKFFSTVELTLILPTCK